MANSGGKFYWKVVTNGGGTEIVHGYFTSLSAATQYALDIYHSDIPLAFLIESEPDYAKNGPFVSCEEMNIMAWDQTTYFDIEDGYGDFMNMTERDFTSLFPTSTRYRQKELLTYIYGALIRILKTQGYCLNAYQKRYLDNLEKEKKDEKTVAL